MDKDNEIEVKVTKMCSLYQQNNCFNAKQVPIYTNSCDVYDGQVSYVVKLFTESKN